MTNFYMQFFQCCGLLRVFSGAVGLFSFNLLSASGDDRISLMVVGHEPLLGNPFRDFAVACHFALSTFGRINSVYTKLIVVAVSVYCMCSFVTAVRILVTYSSASMLFACEVKLGEKNISLLVIHHL